MNIHELEALANQIANEHTEKETKMHRLIRAYARILSVRQPSAFKARALEYSDEDGHWDNSYPPDQQYKNRSGPKLIQVIRSATNDIATESGFYYAWRRVTEDPGLYIHADGRCFGCREEGTGRFGQFAAHPGDCDVHVELHWEELELDDVPFDRLQKAEKELRDLAFPLITQREAQIQTT